MAKGRRQNLKSLVVTLFVELRKTEFEISCCDTVCSAEFLALFGRHGRTDFEGMGGLILKAWED